MNKNNETNENNKNKLKTYKPYCKIVEQYSKDDTHENILKTKITGRELNELNNNEPFYMLSSQQENHSMYNMGINVYKRPLYDL
jgi:hypothetical protein